MLEVLIQILAIVGIVLLIFIGIIFIILCLVLFVPIRYRIYGKKDQQLLVKSKIYWLCHFVSTSIKYEKELILKVKVLGIVIYDNTAPKKVKTTKVKQKKKKVKKQKKKSQQLTQPIDELHKTNKYEDDQKQNDFTSTINDEDEVKDENTPNMFDAFKEKIANQYQKTKEKCKNISSTIGKIKKNLTYYTELLLLEDTKRLLAHGKKRLGKIFKHIAPYYLKGNIVFGTGEPDTTGQGLGIIYILLALIKKEIKVVPDFEQAIYQGELLAKGRIRCGVLVVHIIFLIKDKDFKTVIHKFMKEV